MNATLTEWRTADLSKKKVRHIRVDAGNGKSVFYQQESDDTKLHRYLVGWFETRSDGFAEERTFRTSDFEAARAKATGLIESLSDNEDVRSIEHVIVWDLMAESLV